MLHDCHNSREHISVRIDIIGVEKTDDLARRERQPFVHGIVEPLIGFRDNLGNLAAIPVYSIQGSIR
jgi:hypothetical protein